MSNLQQVTDDALVRIASIETSHDAALVRSEFLGKKGRIGLLLRGLGKVPADRRREAGQEIHAAKGVIDGALTEAIERLEQQAMAGVLREGAFDVTLPGRIRSRGAAHPLRIVEAEIIAALSGLGFIVADGPLVEHDWYNFEALNIAPDHPARDMQDTFFVASDIVLRTHTSNVQIRTMVDTPPPIKILSPGMVFRHDDVDPTHSPVFHQIEGLWIDDCATFADLKGVLLAFSRELFGADVELRFRPSFFPFTEPSTEIDVTCCVCAQGDSQSSCRVCGGSGWIEILGAGMVDPAVLTAVGYDPEKVQGFAFGAGLERIAMLRWGIDDIRLFYENDRRFISQFSGTVTR